MFDISVYKTKGGYFFPGMLSIIMAHNQWYS